MRGEGEPSGIPTLGELLERLRSDVPSRESCIELYRRVAAGERDPTNPPLPDNVVVFACQVMTILFRHVAEEEEVRGGLRS